MPARLTQLSPAHGFPTLGEFTAFIQWTVRLTLPWPSTKFDWQKVILQIPGLSHIYFLGVWGFTALRFRGFLPRMLPALATKVQSLLGPVSWAAQDST